MKRAQFLVPPELRAGALRSAVATLLAGILVLQTALAAPRSAVPKATPEQESAQAAALKQKVLKIQPQSMIVIKMKNKEQLRGRLTQVTDEGFVVKTMRGEEFEDRQLAYAEVTSIKEVSSGSQTKKWIIIGVTIGAIVTVVGILGVLTSDH
jgi:hypothetical protein